MWAKWGVLLGWGALLAIASAQTQIRVEPLLGDSVETVPYPVRIEFRQGGRPTEGRLVLQPRRHYTVEYPVSLPANARKVITISLPDELGWARLLWYTPDRPAEIIELPYPEESHMPVVIVGDAQGGFHMLSNLVYSKEGADRENPIERRWHAVYWTPETVPDDWHAIAGVPVIVLVEGAERLTPEQWRTLTMWVMTGGHLIISVGGVLKQVLPTTPLASLTRAIEKSTDPTLGDHLVKTRDVLHGRVTMFLDDLTAPHWRDAPQMRTLWEQWLANSKSVPYQDFWEGYEKMPHSTEALPLGGIRWVMATIGLMAIAVVFVWWRLRAFGGLASAVPWLVAVGLITTGVITWILPSDLHTNKVQMTQMLLVDKDLPIALHTTVVNLRLKRGAYRFTIPSEKAFMLTEGFGASVRVKHTDSADIELFSRETSRNKLFLLHTSLAPVQVSWKGDTLILEARQGAFRSEPILAHEFSRFWLNNDTALGSPKKRIVIPRETIRRERALLVQMEGIEPPLSLPLAVEREVSWVWVSIQ